MQRIVFSALSALCALSALAEWRVSESVDEMTDAVSYHVATLSADEVEVMPMVTYRAMLVIRLADVRLDDSGALQYKPEVFVDYGSEHCSRTGAPVKYRFDKEPAAEAVWNASQSRSAAFAPDPSAFVAKLRASAKLLFRYETSLGPVRTVSFDLSGLDAALLDAETKYKARPDAKKSAPPAKAQCKACQGRGTVPTWTTCAKCSGKGCAQCNATGANRGKVKRPVKCAACKGRGSVVPETVPTSSMPGNVTR